MPTTTISVEAENRRIVVSGVSKKSGKNNLAQGSPAPLADGAVPAIEQGFQAAARCYWSYREGGVGIESALCPELMEAGYDF